LCPWADIIRIDRLFITDFNAILTAEIHKDGVIEPMAAKKKISGNRKKKTPSTQAATRKSRPPVKKTGRKREMHPVQSFFHQLVQQFGVLRLLLAGAAITGIAAVLKPGTRAIYSGWDMVPTVLVPVIVPMILMVLLLDALMGRVLMADKKGQERERLRITVVVNLLLAAGLILFWLPYYMSLGQ
jgi:hypothetical protein